MYLAGQTGLWQTSDDCKTWNKVLGGNGYVQIFADTILFGSDHQVRRAVLPAADWRSYAIPENGPSYDYEWSHGGHETMLAEPYNPSPLTDADQWHLYVKQDDGPFVRVSWNAQLQIYNALALPGSDTVFAVGQGLPDTGLPGGIWRSNDAGMTWNLIKIPMARDRGFVAPGDPGANLCCYTLFGLQAIRLDGRLVLVAFGAYQGSVASYDDGVTWYPVDGVRADRDFHVELDSLTLVTKPGGLDLFAGGQDGSDWHQSLPGLQVSPVLAQASGADLSGSELPILPAALLVGLAVVAVVVGWLLVARRRHRTRATEVSAVAGIRGGDATGPRRADPGTRLPTRAGRPVD